MFCFQSKVSSSTVFRAAILSNSLKLWLHFLNSLFFPVINETTFAFYYNCPSNSKNVTKCALCKRICEIEPSSFGIIDYQRRKSKDIAAAGHAEMVAGFRRPARVMMATAATVVMVVMMVVSWLLDRWRWRWHVVFRGNLTSISPKKFYGDCSDKIDCSTYKCKRSSFLEQSIQKLLVKVKPGQFCWRSQWPGCLSCPGFRTSKIENIIWLF